MGNINALALIKLRLGKLSRIRLASSFNVLVVVVVEPGQRSMVLIGIELRAGGCGMIGLSLPGRDMDVCSTSPDDFNGGT